MVTATMDYWHTPEDEADIDFSMRGTSMGYGKVLSRLNEGVEADWHVTTTGGGCLAIVAQLEGLQVTVTDFYDTLSTYPERAERRDRGEHTGWAIGIYSQVDDYCECRGWADAKFDHADVAALLEHALADYRRHRGELCMCGVSER